MRTLRWLVAAGFMTMMGTVSSCSTMGGGGMRGYLTDSIPDAVQAQAM